MVKIPVRLIHHDRLFFHCLFWLPVILLAFLSEQRADGAERDCLDLLKSKCLDCHYETRICYKVKKRKSSWSWKRTLKAMRVNGAELSDGEIRRLVSCLSRPDRKVLSYCGASK